MAIPEAGQTTMEKVLGHLLPTEAEKDPGPPGQGQSPHRVTLGQGSEDWSWLDLPSTSWYTGAIVFV